ncbi:hypothetical protein BCR41DRAFT_422989 [Lobosporangium transversale]|uniref:Uncharacterized protein n=1 Tax=Lobosporangium transversale TaxID=64571 RepID=A0A1Y2GJQ7_9FUNG|nr:hypothetical protein BCR41DRAFT_422989 [Lobosporangium transversale]ORZ12907.1 hypothetical protein BCR41DRAFT_422989 [Lobosporangium transversale]|eukprot:XP_021880256.1 hypothetical protein BCR41DRAFT_422989 [Lobosporangium transversale]
MTPSQWMLYAWSCGRLRPMITIIENVIGRADAGLWKQEIKGLVWSLTDPGYKESGNLCHDLLNFLESARESLKKSELTRAVEDEGEGSKPKEPQARRTKRIADKAQAMEHRPSSWNMSPTFSRSLGLLFQFMFA